MKFARTIRFDKSDLNIFPLASEEGELAVVGTFSFYNIKPEDLKGKVKQAFSNGFMGCSTFGYSTLVSLVNISEEELKILKNKLGQCLIDNYGAPSKDVAEKAASEEEGIKEKFRNLPKADSCAEQKIWTVVEED